MYLYLYIYTYIYIKKRQWSIDASQKEMVQITSALKSAGTKDWYGYAAALTLLCFFPAFPPEYTLYHCASVHSHAFKCRFRMLWISLYLKPVSGCHKFSRRSVSVSRGNITVWTHIFGNLYSDVLLLLNRTQNCDHLALSLWSSDTKVTWGRASRSASEPIDGISGQSLRKRGTRKQKVDWINHSEIFVHVQQRFTAVARAKRVCWQSLINKLW